MSLGALELARLLRGRLPSADELEAVRARRVRALVRHAYEKVPYYRRLFDAAGLRPEDIRSAADLRHVPVSSREAVRDAGGDLLARDADPRSGGTARTSGSTGQPLTTFRTRQEDRLRRALDLRSMRWAGVRPRDVVAFLGLTRPPPRRTFPRLGLYRTWDISTLLPVEEQVRRLREIRPSVLWVYSSVLRVLLQEIGSLGAIGPPRLLIHSAEPLDDRLRERIRESGVATRDFYGAVEAGRIAWECVAGEGLHINADWLVVDLEDGSEVPGAGGAAVVTNLSAFAMPFLRYRLGDRCELVERPCSCGIALPLMKPPSGRLWDLIQLPSGRLLSPLPLTVLLRDRPGLAHYRFIQTSVDRMVVQLVFDSEPAPGVLERIRSELAERIGEPMFVDIEVHDSIEDEALKFRAFISELPPPG